MVATDRPSTRHRGCDCPQVTHYHGTIVTYKTHRCRCRDCIGARSRYYKRWADHQKNHDRILPRDEWLKVMRKGLADALAESLNKHGVMS